MADNTTTGSTQDLNELLRQSPFGVLLDITGADGNKISVEDIFGNIGAPGGDNAFSGGVSFDANSPYGGNPFAGDNFWNTFAGGVNPANPTGSTSSSGGFPVSSTPTTSSSTPVDPFAGDGSNFWDAFNGGVNPTTFSSSNVPAFAGSSGSPDSPNTPVPEPSSVLGIAVIGFGIAASKLRQHQKRTVKVFTR
jgi:hypothetical protein